MAVSVVMPQLGESVVEGTITKWLVRVGDAVQKDQPLVTVATDKADNEIPSPASGVVSSILAAEGQVVPVNSPLAAIETSAAAPSAEPRPISAAPAPPSSADAAAAAVVGATPSALITAPSMEPVRREARDESATARTSPAVRKAALELGVDVSQVRGSGDNGRVTKQDVVRAAEVRPAARQPAADAAPSPVGGNPVGAAPRAPAPSAFRVPAYVEQPGDEVVPFNRRRRIIADHMVYSKHVAPHVMTIAEIDMHKTARVREARKNAAKAEGINLTYLAFIAAATARALRENPLLNARVLDDAYVKLRRINLGIAVETPDGLVVPVVRDADGLTVKGLARAIDQLATKARDGKITADDLAGATFTISNPGLKGNFVGAAVISQPNVGILRIGELVKRPVVVEVDGQDTIAVHPVMFAALSYDHRIVDGVAANAFLYRVTELLEAGQFEV